jgi:hypothetical protein
VPRPSFCLLALMLVGASRIQLRRSEIFIAIAHQKTASSYGASANLWWRYSIKIPLLRSWFT